MPIQTRSMTLGRNNTSTSVAGKNTNYHSGVQTRRMRQQERFNTLVITRSMSHSNKEMSEIFDAANTLMMLRHS
jgi:hypothetical protein